ncbi:protein mono-ADP-ribosyltransferase PARP11-like [Diorhabda sublineata]|uniref:protein mono-ADP-ribosyltransferase PARP11-like n=1 Tax=Diorhabda sublineata TaxID=1163346 RepID=UPI0024E10E1E|nr:protein mono-ADP-ribosyltransferase PARP11-like [Diorhabda sublineata]
MLVEQLEYLLPNSWIPMDLRHEKFKVVQLHPSTTEYHVVQSQLGYGTPYFSAIQGVYRVQNPILYAKFRIKAYDFEQRGQYSIKSLFHDTSRENVESICSFNFDWRFGERFKFGPGVYFSTSPYLANKHSSKNNGLFRTMFLTQVLTQNIQTVPGEIFLPDYGFDTALVHNGETYVKYFDGEYYPQYFINYIAQT